MTDPAATLEPQPPDGTRDAGGRLPPGETLATWAQTLTPRNPTRLWYAQLSVCHLEALAGVTLPFEPDPIQQAVLRGLGATPTPPSRLHVEPQVLTGVLRELSDAGLIERDPSGVRLSSFALSTPGDTFTALRYERRRFAFLDNTSLGSPLAFLDLGAGEFLPPTSAGIRVPVSEALDALRRCIRRPSAWKADHGFPTEVACVCAGETEDWRRVVVAHGEKDSFLLAEVGEKVFGYPVGHQAAVDGGNPRFALPDWREAFPDLETSIPAENWQGAWQEWAKDAGVPLSGEEAAACPSPPEGRRVVTIPAVLKERVRTADGPLRPLLVRQGPRAWAIVEVVWGER